MKYLALIIIASLGAAKAKADTVVPASGGKPSVILAVDESHLSKRLSYKWGFDPFYKTPGFVKGEPKEPTLQLKGVLHGEDESSAIINKKTVYVNSVIDGYTVKEIGDNYVVVQRGDNLRELQLAPILNKTHSEINVYDRMPALDSSEDATGED